MNKLGIIASALLAALYFKDDNKNTNSNEILLFDEKDLPTTATHQNVKPSGVQIKPFVRLQLNDKGNLVTDNNKLVAQGEIEFKRSSYTQDIAVKFIILNLFIKNDAGEYVKVCDNVYNGIEPNRFIFSSGLKGSLRGFCRLNWDVIKFPSKAYRKNFLEQIALNSTADKSKLIYADYHIEWYEGTEKWSEINPSEFRSYDGLKVPCGVEYVYKQLIS